MGDGPPLWSLVRRTGGEPFACLWPSGGQQGQAEVSSHSAERRRECMWSTACGKGPRHPWGAVRDPGKCPVLSLHRTCPGVDRSCRPHPTTLILSFHQVIGRGGYAPLTPCPLKSGLGRARLWPRLQAPCGLAVPSGSPSWDTHLSPSRTLPWSRAALSRTEAAAPGAVHLNQSG